MLNNGKTIDINSSTVLITGAAGFIGASLAVRLLEGSGCNCVVGIDNMNDYYDPALKRARLQWIADAASSSSASWQFFEESIADKSAISEIFANTHPTIVVNLAAQAGVRYSIDHPDAYIGSNVIGFYNILETCRHYPVDHLVYASSSSVYGNNAKVPFSTDDKTDEPISLYAATKKSNELMAHAYSELYGIPATGLRFFTVYGPFGRPDMFVYSAAEKLLAGETIQLYGNGLCRRDFTYIDDIVEGVVRVMFSPLPHRKPGDSTTPHAVYNIGGGTPEYVISMIATLQENLVKAGALSPDYDVEAHRELVGMQPGDMPLTFADTSALERDYGFKPRISLSEGIRRFVEWFVHYRSSNAERG